MSSPPLPLLWTERTATSAGRNQWRSASTSSALTHVLTTSRRWQACCRQLASRRVCVRSQLNRSAQLIRSNQGASIGLVRVSLQRESFKRGVCTRCLRKQSSSRIPEPAFYKSVLQLLRLNSSICGLAAADDKDHPCRVLLCR